jgi:hypothetical protein
MNFYLRILLAFLLLGIFIGGMFVVEQLALPLITTDTQLPGSGTLLNSIFTKADFRYGPHLWRPYYDPLAIDPTPDASRDDTWYMMYVDLNGTPVSGNPDVRRLGALKVSYNFSALAGKAVFHVYGSRHDGTQTRTNRQDGYNRCGFVVRGLSEPGQSMPATTILNPSGSHEYTVTIANIRGENSNDFSSASRTLRFERAGSGLDAIHITGNLTVPKGQVTDTEETQGTFFITSNGENPTNHLLLLIAVNRMQPDRFSLNLKSEFVGGS